MATANQITVFLDPTQLPARTQDQATFDNFFALFMQLLPTFGAQFNAGIANFNAAASGMAYAIPYTIDLSSTADADPGSGKLRFDNATQNTATTLRLDLLGTGLVDYTAVIDTFDASTNVTSKGAIRIIKQGDASKFLLFNVLGRTAPSGYRDIIVTPAASSSANPFVSGDAVLLFFQRAGDKGDIGTPVLVFHAQETQASGGGAVAGTVAAVTGIAPTTYRRVLNTVVTNQIPGASLSGNQITLPAGTYKGRAMCSTHGVQVSSGGIGSSRLTLFNATDSAIINTGSSQAGFDPATSAVARVPHVEVLFEFTLAAARVIDLRQTTTTVGSSAPMVAWGYPASIGRPEVYTDVIIEKIG